VAHWPGAQLRQLFEERPRPDGPTADNEVLKLLGATAVTEPETDSSHVVDDFWDRAASNLAARKLRLLFVADVIPPELQRIVEFLNENLVRVEVLAVEVKQYVGEGRQTLVPRVIGRTAAAEDVKQTATGATRVVRTWTEPEFLEAVATTGGPDAEHLARACLDWNRRHGVEILFGKGKFGPLYFQAQIAPGILAKIANVNTQGYTMVSYDTLAKFPPFDRVEERVELNRRLNRIAGVQIPERAAAEATWPGIHLQALASEPTRAKFVEVLDWVSARLVNRP
jgi:hypothetical protein